MDANEQHKAPEKEFIKIEEAAEIVKFEVPTLYKWVCYRYIPFYKISSHLRFEKNELIQWVLSHRIDPSDDDE